MRHRYVLEQAAMRVVAALLLVLAALGAACRKSPIPTPQDAAAACRCAPGKPCWPAPEEWQRLGASLHGKLEQPQDSPASKNPFELQDHAGATQSVGWLGAWNAALSAFAVVAEDAADIQAAVSFARAHRLRLVVKGTGHDYLGRSNAPDSLLVWTHRMRQVSVHDAFVPRGCAAPPAAVPAVSLGAGTRWIEAYEAVTVKSGRYVQGGGCTSVGAAGGFMQGGGFGSWSKKYGIAAASLLEAEVVTADGKLRIANGCQDQDLFWALRGGGGGTFGIVTRVTLRTHPLPEFFGALQGSIAAKDDAAFRELLERFVGFYRESLSNEHWGEQVKVRRNNSLELSLVFEGMTAKEAGKAWQPLREWVERSPDKFTMKADFVEVPGQRMWDQGWLKEHAPGAIQEDGRPGLWWWTGDGEQVSAFWYAYESRWLPARMFEPANAKKLAELLFDASRHWSVGIHFNKGQAGAADEAVRRGRETSMNPAVYDAAALVIIAAAGAGQDKTKAEAAKAGVAAAMKVLRDATPGAGTYVNEADYFELDWQQEFWGPSYERLSQIKRKYDPEDLFFCHHCVGSERWSKDGSCRMP